MPTYTAHTLSAGQTSGCQDVIQTKLILDLCKLLLDIAGGSDEETWYGEVNVNGLCAGWSLMHRLYGESMEDAWNAIKAWVPVTPLAGDACHDELLRLKNGALRTCSHEYFAAAPDAATVKAMLVDVSAGAQGGEPEGRVDGHGARVRSSTAARTPRCPP